MRLRALLIILLIQVVVLSGCDDSHTTKHEVLVVGAMKNVMWKGELQGVVDVDTLQRGKQLQGIGPAHVLQGEIMVVDGVPYRSRINADSQVVVEVAPHAMPPFFVYAYVDQWKEQPLPDSVTDLLSLEAYLQKTIHKEDPFAFQLKGAIQEADIHIQNLAEGSVVRSPKEAHAGQVNLSLQMRQVQMLGFFSTQHQGIYTHHDAFTHVHLITMDTSMMGHADRVEWTPGAMKLLLPY